MKLWLMSDIHMEFHADGGRDFLNTLPDLEHDLAVIAGDLCDFKILRRSLELVCARFKRVAYVLGNHECYGGSIARAHQVATQAASEIPNLHYLDCSYIEVDGIRIHGHTLWFPYPNRENYRYEKGMNDFYQIGDFRNEVGLENQRALRYLEGNVRRGDVVVTHHLPVKQSVNKKYAHSPLNAYFVGKADAVLLGKEPKLWCHGHIHNSADYVLGSTRVVVNPYGYWAHEENPDFDPGLIINL